jgi:hypothetical protein
MKRREAMRWLGGLLLLLLPVQGVAAGERLEAGAYRIRYRLELPHLERWAVEKTDTACVTGPPVAGHGYLPILSANMPFKGCTVRALQTNGKFMDYDIACPGRGAAKAHAVYTLSEDGFEARIFMTMGAKNMTMTEIQQGRRTGTCALAGSP